MPAKPGWRLAIPEAINQLEQLDRQLLTRRDIERLFGVGKVRAAALMQPFGAADESSFSSSKKHRGGAVPRRGGETRAPDRRTPAGPADRVPVEGALARRWPQGLVGR